MMRGILDFQTAQEIVDRRIRVLEAARVNHELTEEDAAELDEAYRLRERVMRAGIRAVAEALDELETA
jgi:hypothetical protein